MTLGTRPTAPPGAGRPGEGLPVGYRATVRRLAAKQKTVKGAPAYSRFVNRLAGRYLAAAAYQVGITPNQVTAVSAVFSFAGIAVVALVRPAIWVGVVVTVLLVVGYALDAADGQLARLRGGGSPAGEWLDHMVDCTKISTLHLMVGVSFYRFSDLGRAYLFVPLGYTIVAAVTFFGMILNELLLRIRAAATGATVPVVSSAPVLKSLLVLPTDYGFLCLVFLLFGVGGHAFAIGYGLMAAASLAFLLLALVRWYGVMAALGPPAAVVR